MYVIIIILNHSVWKCWVVCPLVTFMLLELFSRQGTLWPTRLGLHLASELSVHWEHSAFYPCPWSVCYSFKPLQLVMIMWWLRVDVFLTWEGVLTHARSKWWQLVYWLFYESILCVGFTLCLSCSPQKVGCMRLATGYIHVVVHRKQKKILWLWRKS